MGNIALQDQSAMQTGSDWDSNEPPHLYQDLGDTLNSSTARADRSRRLQTEGGVGDDHQEADILLDTARLA